MMKRIVGILVVALGIVACGGEENDASTLEGNGVAIKGGAPTGTTPANGGSPAAGAPASPAASPSAPALNEFLGRWTATGSEVITYHLPQGPVSDAVSVTPAITIAEGVDTDLVFVSGDIVYPAKLKGSSATFEAGSEWTVPTEYGPCNFRLTNGSATLNGNTIQWSMSGTFTFIANGATVSATFTAQYTMTKVSK